MMMTDMRVAVIRSKVLLEIIIESALATRRAGIIRLVVVCGDGFCSLGIHLQLADGIEHQHACLPCIVLARHNSLLRQPWSALIFFPHRTAVLLDAPMALAMA